MCILTLTSLQINLKVENVIFYSVEQYVLHNGCTWILVTVFQYIVWLMILENDTRNTDLTAFTVTHSVWKQSSKC
jgi:hypothetical protein